MKFSLVLIILAFSLFSQNSISEAEKSLLKLKDEIADLQEYNLQLNENIDKNKDMIKAYHYRVKLAEKNKRYKVNSLKYVKKQIVSNNKRLKQLRAEIKQIKKSYAKRMSDSYKLPKANSFELILNAKSDNQLMRMLYYKKMIDQAERRLIKELNTKTKQVTAVDRQLTRNKRRSERLIVEQKKAIRNLDKIEKRYRNDLKKNLSNKKKYARMIKDKEAQTQNLKKLIARLSKVKKNSVGKVALSASENVKLSKEFKKNKGRFATPAKGKVIKPFGKVKVKGLKIYEQSIGIDIASKKGSSAKSIFAGIVEQAAYMQGYGNQIIVNHGGGYFTIYSHLNDMHVSKGDRVTTNQVIGTVGDSGTYDGIPRLNFAMFGNNKPMNPAKWLR